MTVRVWGDENVLKVTAVVVAHICKYKNTELYILMVNCMVGELYPHKRLITE